MSKKKVTIEDVRLDPSKLVPDPDNPRVNDDAVPALIEGITKYDFINPIIVDDNLMILAGHTRQKAALEMGLKEVPVRIVHGYSKAQKIGFALTDNKISELSGWDVPKLNFKLEQIELEEPGIDMSLFGFDVDPIDSYDAHAVESDAGEELKEGDVIDIDEPVPESPKVLVFLESEEGAEALYQRLTDEGYSCKIV